MLSIPNTKQVRHTNRFLSLLMVTLKLIPKRKASHLWVNKKDLTMKQLVVCKASVHPQLETIQWVRLIQQQQQ
jgi:hypothetical protein